MVTTSSEEQHETTWRSDESKILRSAHQEGYACMLQNRHVAVFEGLKNAA